MSQAAQTCQEGTGVHGAQMQEPWVHGGKQEHVESSAGMIKSCANRGELLFPQRKVTTTHPQI